MHTAGSMNSSRCVPISFYIFITTVLANCLHALSLYIYIYGILTDWLPPALKWPHYFDTLELWCSIFLIAFAKLNLFFSHFLATSHGRVMNLSYGNMFSDSSSYSSPSLGATAPNLWEDLLCKHSALTY